MPPPSPTLTPAGVERRRASSKMAASGAIVSMIAEESSSRTAVAEFDEELFAFRCWCCFLPAGPSEELENLGSYVKLRAIGNPKFYEAVLAELQELQDTLRIESTSSQGLRAETLLKAKWSCLEAQKFAIGFLQTRQLRRALKLGEEVLQVLASCIEKAQASVERGSNMEHHLRALLFLHLLGRMNLGVVYARGRRYLDAAELFNQNLSIAEASPEELAESRAERGPKEMVVIGACHTQMYLLNLAIDQVDLAAEHAFRAVEVLEQSLPEVPTEEQDVCVSVNILAAAFGNAGVMSVRQANADRGTEWLEKALAALGGILGSSNALRDELKDQLAYAKDLWRYGGAEAVEDEGSKPGALLDQSGPQEVVEGVH